MSTPQLYWLGEDGKENIRPLSAEEVLIGRKSEADIVIDNKHVSRFHAKLIKTAQGYSVQDVGSTHGTFVNEIPVGPNETPQLLKHGDRISLGKDRIELQYFIGDAKIARPQSTDTTQIFE